MTDARQSLRLVDISDDGLPLEREEREARHALLASFLGAYADGELPAETRSQIDAHLAGCARCRRELSMQSAVRARLEREPVVPASAALRERIMTGVKAAGSPPPLASVPTAPRAWWASRSARIAAFATILLVAVALSFFRQPSAARAIADAPPAVTTSALVAEVVSDYRKVTAGDLPGRARDLAAVRAAVPFPVEPLEHPALRLLAAWTTDLGGEAAAVLAYRSDDQLVLHYLVSEQSLFASPALRSAIAARRPLRGAAGAQRLMLWAAPQSGALLVTELPTGRLDELYSASVPPGPTDR